MKVTLMIVMLLLSGCNVPTAPSDKPLSCAAASDCAELGGEPAQWSWTCEDSACVLTPDYARYPEDPVTVDVGVYQAAKLLQARECRKPADCEGKACLSSCLGWACIANQCVASGMYSGKSCVDEATGQYGRCRGDGTCQSLCDSGVPCWDVGCQCQAPTTCNMVNGLCE